MSKRTTLVLAITAALAVTVFAADTPKAPDRAAILDAARDVMQKSGYCALITIGEKGDPQARIVDPFPPEADMTVWIATKPVTRKVAQIKKDSRVTLLYFHRDGMGYVTLLGKAELVTEPAEKAKHWKEEWSAFYDNKNRGDDYLLIRVKPAHLEIVSYAHGLTGDPKTWKPITLDLP
jgi:general stress protein 26